MGIAATYWVVSECETRLAGRRNGWYVERRTNDGACALVSALYSRQAKAKAEARRLNLKSKIAV
jgi:hypothetical protein